MLRFFKFIFALAFVIWAAGSTDSSLAFDVCAYWDPQSYVKVHSWDGAFNFFDCDGDSGETPFERAQALAHVLPLNEQVYDLYDSMGLTILQVYTEDSAAIYDRFAGHNFKIINDWWYSPRFRYVEGADCLTTLL